MFLQHWLKLWANTPLFTNLKAGIQSIPGYRASVQGVDPTAGGFLIAGLAGHLYRPILVIAADASRAEEIYEELLVYFPRSRVHLLPPRELFVTGDLLSRSSEPSQQRLHFLNWAISGKEGIYVASLGAVFNRSLPPDYCDLTLKLEPEQRVDRVTWSTTWRNSVITGSPDRGKAVQCPGRFSIFFPSGREAIGWSF